MDEYTQQPTRRRKQPPIPQWQRILRRYWPTIRFGLICFILLAIVILLIDGIISLFSKDPNVPADTTFYAAQQLSCVTDSPDIETQNGFCI